MSDENLMATQIRQLFNGADECLSAENDEHFFIIEDNKSKSIIAKNLEEKNSGFEIENPDQKNIYLLAVDSCLFTSKDESRCDCILFDDRVFCFVELKLNVHKHKQATVRLKEAQKQLVSSIIFFRKEFETNNEDFLGFKLEAYVVMREHIYPKNRAGRKPVLVKFFDDYGVELFEKSKKVFGDHQPAGE